MYSHMRMVYTLILGTYISSGQNPQRPTLEQRRNVHLTVQIPSQSNSSSEAETEDKKVYECFDKALLWLSKKVFYE